MKIIKIGALWCPGCLVMKKVWNNIKISKDIDIEELDYDMNSEEVEKCNPGSILPVVIFLDKNNRELERLIGEQKEEKILDIISKYEGL